ncbi:transposase [Nitrosomonas sp.]|uniref:transposase n=1 Tax=Nitrosomonas sp. TaxID=42353 RepID=UPI0025E46F64|nr:transposase [Nitrosomonas sp.]MBS0587843.1 transposase [Pseudomonadota bacterium]
MIAKSRYVVERTFGSQAQWFNVKILRHRSLAKTHAWRMFLAMAYNLKNLSGLLHENDIRKAQS